MCGDTTHGESWTENSKQRRFSMGFSLVYLVLGIRLFRTRSCVVISKNNSSNHTASVTRETICNEESKFAKMTFSTELPVMAPPSSINAGSGAASHDFSRACSYVCE